MRLAFEVGALLLPGHLRPGVRQGTSEQLLGGVFAQERKAELAFEAQGIVLANRHGDIGDPAGLALQCAGGLNRMTDPHRLAERAFDPGRKPKAPELPHQGPSGDFVGEGHHQTAVHDPRRPLVLAARHKLRHHRIFTLFGKAQAKPDGVGRSAAKTRLVASEKAAVHHRFFAHLCSHRALAPRPSGLPSAPMTVETKEVLPWIRSLLERLAQSDPAAQSIAASFSRADTAPAIAQLIDEEPALSKVGYELLGRLLANSGDRRIALMLLELFTLVDDETAVLVAQALHHSGLSFPDNPALILNRIGTDHAPLREAILRLLFCFEAGYAIAKPIQDYAEQAPEHEQALVGALIETLPPTLRR